MCGMASPVRSDLKPKVLGEIIVLLDKCGTRSGPVYDLMKQVSTQKTATVECTDTEANNCVVCTSCSNWLSRLVKSDGIFTKQPFIPMDGFLMFLCTPGDYAAPDKRALPRLVETITSTSLCMYSNLAPMYVHTIPELHVAMIRTSQEELVQPQVHTGLDYTKHTNTNSNEQLLHAIVIAWWKYNGHSLVFTSSAASKLVRRALDNGKKMHLNDPVLLSTLPAWLREEWTNFSD